VLNGKINHHINSALQTLSTGDLVFIRPSDHHYFAPLKDEKCELINLAVKLDSLIDVSRYLGNDQFLENFTGSVIPVVFKMQNYQIDETANELLSINSYQITNPLLSRIKAKVFLVNIFTKYFLSDDFSGENNSSVPQWLKSLCGKLKDPENLRTGIEAMSALAPCTHEHLCKVCKKYLKKTPSELILGYRLETAARKLSGTQDKIFTIASELGFKSISYFHKEFKNTYSMSPAAYRKHSKVCGLIPV